MSAVDGEARDRLAVLCLSFLKPSKSGGSWTLNPTALADAILAAGWVGPEQVASVWDHGHSIGALDVVNLQLFNLPATPNPYERSEKS